MCFKSDGKRKIAVKEQQQSGPYHFVPQNQLRCKGTHINSLLVVKRMELFK